jgi:hypothetical protein
VSTTYQTPDYWRSRAEEARAQAEQMKDADAKQALRKIAEIYEQLAEQAELEIKSTTPPGSRPPAR